MDDKQGTSETTVYGIAGFVAFTIGSVILTVTVVQGINEVTGINGGGLVSGVLVTVLGLALIMVAVARALALHEQQARDVRRAANDLARIARYLREKDASGVGSTAQRTES